MYVNECKLLCIEILLFGFLWKQRERKKKILVIFFSMKVKHSCAFFFYISALVKKDFYTLRWLNQEFVTQIQKIITKITKDIYILLEKITIEIEQM